MHLAVWPLTLTYRDVYDRIHATIIDETDNDVFHIVAFLEDIPHDLHTVDQRDREKRTP